MPNINLNGASVTVPAGSIDFSKPLQTDDGDAVTIVAVLPVGEYPVLVQIAGDEQVEQINGEGNSLSGSVEIQNAPETPGMVYGRLMNNGGSFYFDEETFSSEDAARQAYVNSGERLVSVFPVTIPSQTAEVAGDLTNVVLNGRTISVGDTVSAYRKRFGARQATVLKIRNDVTKSLYIDPQDGNNPYWALNRNIQ